MIRWLIDHGTTVILATLVVFFAGVYSYVTLPREASPDITIPVVIVSTPYIGVSPKDVETLVTIPLENELSGLQDVKEMSSTSAEGVSIIVIEFEPDIVIEDALQKVRDRVSTAESELPADAEESFIREISFSDMPILIVTIAGAVDEETLKAIGEDLEDAVTRIPGVLEANLSGGLEREIHVDVDPVRLSHYGLSLDDVSQAIRDENQNIPAGEVVTGDSNVLFRVPGEFTDARQIEDVPIKRVGDMPVFIRDVARVVDGYEDRATYARMNSETAVSLAVTKRPGENIIFMADEVKRLVEAQSQDWPEGVSYRILADQSKLIRNMVTELQNNIITALILVVAVILLFMGWRSSSFVAIAIPLSMLISFMVLDTLGFTLNMIVLFSLILALGMLVDNAIVVVENIFRHGEEGKDRRRAAIDGTEEVAVAVAASTATTVAAFFPLVFWGGIMGEFMGFLPKTLIVVLIASLAVAIYALPVFMRALMKNDNAPVEAGPGDLEETPLPTDEYGLTPLEEPTGMMAAYRSLLEWSIRHRYLSLMAGFATMIFTFAMYGMFNHGTEFFPETDPDRVVVRIIAPHGTDLETTDSITRRVERILNTEANVDVYVSEVGVSASGDALSGSSARASEAKITVDFLPNRNDAMPGDRVRVGSTNDTVTDLRAKVLEIPGVRIQIEPEGMGPPVGAPINVQVSGEDYHEVGAFALDLRRKIAKIPGVTDLREDYKVGRPELALRIDRAAAKRVGVNTGQIGGAIRTAVAGSEASAVRDGEHEYKIIVRVAEQYRQDLPSVLDLRVPGRTDTSPDTFPVPLSSVARYELAGGTGAIGHIDQDLVVTIEGDVLADYNENDVRTAIQELIDGLDTGDLVISMGGADQEQQEAAEFLGRAMLIALALIMMVLVTQFDSLTTPLIIMASVVLSLTGVLWGLLITGTPFGVIMTGIGVISLAGVVVNNAIVLLDYVEQLRHRGMDFHEALVRAGITRFRPVMLTAITTVLGLVPMAVGVSIDFTRMRILVGGSSAQFWGPMAIAVIFGLSFATVLTLILVPTMYTILQDLTHLRERIQQALKSKPAAAAAKVLPLLLVLGAAQEARGQEPGDPPVSADAITLPQAIMAAQEANYEYLISQEQTYQSELVTGRAWSILQPRVDVGATYNLNQFDVIIPASSMGAPAGTPDVVIQEKQYWSGQARVNQPVFYANAPYLLKGSYRLADAARLDQEFVKATVFSGTARAFYDLAVARATKEVAEAALETRNDQLELAERQSAAGVSPRSAVLQAELLVRRAERAIAQAEESVVQAEESFHKVTGLPRTTQLVIPEPLTPPASLEEALGVALASRPDLQAADQRILASRMDLRAKQMEWLPTLDASFTYALSEAGGFAGQNAQWMAGLNFNWNLWDGGLRITQSKEKASQLRIAEYQRSRKQQDVEQEVRSAWVAFERAQYAMESVRSELEIAEDGLTLQQRGFAAGSTNWLDLRQAELDLRTTQVDVIAERMDRDMAVIDLLVAMGTPRAE